MIENKEQLSKMAGADIDLIPGLYQEIINAQKVFATTELGCTGNTKINDLKIDLEKKLGVYLIDYHFWRKDGRSKISAEVEIGAVMGNRIAHSNRQGYEYGVNPKINSFGLQLNENGGIKYLGIETELGYTSHGKPWPHMVYLFDEKRCMPWSWSERCIPWSYHSKGELEKR